MEPLTACHTCPYFQPSGGTHIRIRNKDNYLPLALRFLLFLSIDDPRIISYKDLMEVGYDSSNSVDWHWTCKQWLFNSQLLTTGKQSLTLRNKP